MLRFRNGDLDLLLGRFEEKHNDQDALRAEYKTMLELDFPLRIAEGFEEGIREMIPEWDCLLELMLDSMFIRGAEKEFLKYKGHRVGYQLRSYSRKLPIKTPKIILFGLGGNGKTTFAMALCEVMSYYRPFRYEEFFQFPYFSIRAVNDLDGFEGEVFEFPENYSGINTPLLWRFDRAGREALGESIIASIVALADRRREWVVPQVLTIQGWWVATSYRLGGVAYQDFADSYPGKKMNYNSKKSPPSRQ